MPNRRTLLALAAGGAAMYGAALLAVSLTSDQVVLGFRQPKRFCGLYLDCHRMVEVAEVETTDVLVSGADSLHADGRFHLVTLTYRSDAVAATLDLGPQAATVHDAVGRTWDRDLAAEAMLAGSAGLIDAPITAGGAFTTRIVFDLPAGVPEPLLDIRDAHPLARLTELLLIGDEDSFLHRRTRFALSGQAPRSTTLHPSGVDLLAVRVDTAAGPGSASVPADGVFYVVTLLMRADAPFTARVVDASGREYDRAHDVEQLLSRYAPLTQPARVRLVFDLPDRVESPRLILRQPGLRGRLFGHRIILNL